MVKEELLMIQASARSYVYRNYATWQVFDSSRSRIDIQKRFSINIEILRIPKLNNDLNIELTGLNFEPGTLNPEPGTMTI
jgi:hypothetical protein